MEIFESISGIKDFVHRTKSSSKTIGFVPTMGNLHDGHLSLIKTSLSENDITIVSIFVNPLQFNNQKDLDKYPRTIEADREKLKKVGCHALFIPSKEGFYSQTPQLTFDFGALEHVLEGKFRPGHFNGVAVVVSRLFNITTPNSAYFGQKDLQQYRIIESLVNDLAFDINLKMIPVSREKNGLAMSSRNNRLSTKARQDAAVIYQGLLESKKLYEKGKSSSIIKDQVLKFYENANIEIEYFEIIHSQSLQKADEFIKKSSYAICVAALIEEVRLIDNIIL